MKKSLQKCFNNHNVHKKKDGMMKKIMLFVPILFIFTYLLISCTEESKSNNTFIDQRDGHKYKIVTIGQQTWMAENLNYRSSSGTCFYNNDSVLMSEQYGRLYNWQAALSAVPSGWRLPSKSDWDVLINSLGKDTLAYKNILSDGESGFDALLGGYYSNGIGFSSLGFEARFWSSSAELLDEEWPYFCKVDQFNKLVVMEYGFKTDYLSVRCIKD
jgi:uncharacterized protein (TIGR02145 family)